MKFPTFVLFLTCPLAGQQLCGEAVDKKFWTEPERNGWTRTSSSTDVRKFLDTLRAGYPGVFELGSIGKTLQGREIQVAVIKRPAEAGHTRLRVVIQANIHGGEVEGKEAVQVLLREIAMGGHQSILRHADLWFVPIFNVDGNDEFHPQNRTAQNGPAVVGKRTNAQDLDLNRDFVKVETPEARAMLGLFQKADPHFYMDLHTTNGTTHGYHLTYAPSLSPHQDPAIDALMHERFIPAIRKAVLKNHGIRIFDYGNTSRRGSPPTWTTYGHTPRYASNYVALRNRLSLLSEAYSYLPFRERALATRAFVLESLHELVRRREEVLKICAEAELRVLEGKVRLVYQTSLVTPEAGEILMGSVNLEGDRRVANADYKPVNMGIQVRFEAKKSLHYPLAWVVTKPSPAVRHALLIHGLDVEVLHAPVEVAGETFVIRSKTRARFVYEGHKVVEVKGDFKEQACKLAVGDLVIRSRQAYGRVAAQLLEAQSEDSLTTWNFFDAQIEGDSGVYPVIRLHDPAVLASLNTRKLDADKQDLLVAGPYVPAPKQIPADRVDVRVRCLEAGTRSTRGGYERGGSWQGRKIEYQLDGQAFTDRSLFLTKAALVFASKPRPCVLVPGNAITGRELHDISTALKGVGAKIIYLDRKPE
jgi:hypothetical protein